jgi:hypothetical protein
MRGCIKIACFFVFLFFCSCVVSASCSLGATPLGMGAEAKPGQEVMVTWNFYNLYGDRMTHIIISKISGPDWEIRYDPVIHEENYNISGVIISKTENLAVENSSVTLKIPENSPEGISYVKHPNKEGYIQVNPVKIYIKIPEDAKLWQDYEFSFEVKGSCFTDPGTVIPAIATQLRVDIIPKGDFYEKVAYEEKKGGIFSGITGGVIGSSSVITNIFAATTILLLIILLVLLIKKKRT